MLEFEILHLLLYLAESMSRGGGGQARRARAPAAPSHPLLLLIIEAFSADSCTDVHWLGSIRISDQRGLLFPI
jgi:hypothetical protein